MILDPSSGSFDAARSADAGPLWVLGNRQSGRGRGRRLAPQLDRLFRSYGFPVPAFWPDSRQELRRLAAQAVVAGVRRLVVVGGDGTLVDVVNEIWGRGIEVGLVPAGDANDFAAALGLPRDPLLAAELLKGWNTRPIDLVRAQMGDDRQRVYVGVGGAGLDSEAARLAAGPFRRLPRVWRYLAGALTALVRFHPFDLALQFDGRSYRGRVLLAAAANAPAYGGGIRIAPEARLDDGWLEIVLLESLRWRQVIAALPALVRKGELCGLNLRRFRVRRVRLEAAPPAAFHGDGERLGMTPLTLDVVPGALRVVCPGSSSS